MSCCGSLIEEHLAFQVEGCKFVPGFSPAPLSLSLMFIHLMENIERNLIDREG